MRGLVLERGGAFGESGRDRRPVVERGLQRRGDAGHELAVGEVAADDHELAVPAAAFESCELHVAPFQLST